MVKVVKFVILVSEASVTAGLAALAVILIRLAMKKAPKRWAYALWAVVFFRCLCPFSAESAVSLFNVIPDHATETVEVVDSSGTASEIDYYVPAIVQVEETLKSYGYTTPSPAAAPSKPVPKKNPFHMYTVIFTVWAVGAAAMALYGVISYILLMRKLKTAVKTEEGVYESDLISTAFSAGFFPPKIYVPCGLFEEERKLIVAHERVHIRRLDYIVKPLAFLGLTVHWFNPLIWLSFALMTKDMELSCDEAVLKIFGAEEKKAYSEALLHVSMKRSGLIDNYKFMPLAFAETGIKGRVKNVLKYKKPTLIVTVLAAAAVIAACAVLGTDAKSKAEDSVENAGYTQIQNGEAAVLLAGGEEIPFELGAPSSWDIVTESGKNVIIPVDPIDTQSDGKKVLKIYHVLYGEEIIDGELWSVSYGAACEDYELWYVGIEQAKIDNMFIETVDGVRQLNIEMTITPENEREADKLKSAIDLHARRQITCSCEKSGDDLICKFSMGLCEVTGGEGYYSIALDGFDDIPVYINSDLVKAEENVYVPLSEGETVYSLDIGKNVCAANYPDRDAEIADSVRKITFNAEPEEGSKHRSVMIGMRAKNNELNRQCGADFTGEEITGLAIDDISVSQDKFTVKFKITYPEGGGGFFANENESNSNIRLVRINNKNVSYLYLTADYDRGNVDEYAIDICGFDEIIPQINAKFSVTEEKAAEYTRILGGWAEFTLETGETGYAAYNENDIPVNADDWTFSTKGIEGKGISIGCITAFDEGSGEADFRDVIDFGNNTITAVTVENMYTERVGSNVKLYTKIKVASPDGDGLMNSMSVNCGEAEMSVAKLINDEYLFTVIKEYNIHEDVAASFAVVVKGFETPPEINTDYEIPVYVNSALDPHSPQIITYDAYSDLTDEEALQKRIEEERRRLQEEEQKKLSEEAEEKLRSSQLLQYPVSAPISDSYGNREETRDFNKGINFAVIEGTPVYAAGKGTVLNADDDNNGYGLCVIIDHGGGELATLYAHLSEISVKEGDEVNAGDLIGYSGKTGSTYGATLHFEVRVNGQHVDPVEYIALQERGTVSATYYDMTSTLVLNKDGTFSVKNYSSSYIPLERPEKEYKFENGILSLEFTNGSVICFEAVGNDLVYRKDLSNYIYSIDIPSFGSNGTLELIAGTSLNGGSIEMDTMKLGGKTYCLVSNETQLRAIGGTLYGLDLDYIQQCDIELSSQEWKPIGTRGHPFTGSYNGNGFEIKGLTMTDPYAPLIGMFGYAENANIYNITLRDYDIEKAGSKAKSKSVAPIVAINDGSRVYDNNVYPKE